MPVTIQYILQRLKDLNYKQMWDKINSMHEKTGKGRLALLWDVRGCAVKYGAGYMDYDLYEMYNLTPKQRDTYLTRGRNNDIVRRYNDPAHRPDFDSKIAFNGKFSAFLRRDWVPVLQDNREAVMSFLDRHPQFMAKPDNGSCGWGIEKLDASDFPDREALYRHLLERAPDLELEELIQQHPAVAAVYPGSINTVRMVTLLGDSGKVHHVSAMFRIGNGRFVDNFNSGGMVAPVDRDSGVVTDRALDKKKNLYTHHPATGTPIQGFAFPDWDRAWQMVEAAARLEPELRYVGWDVCFTPDGPCLVEGNPFPGHDIYQLPVHTPNKVGMMPVYWAIEEEEAAWRAQHPTA